MTRARLDRFGSDLGELVEAHGGRRTVDPSEYEDDPVVLGSLIGRESVDYQAEVMRSVAFNRFTLWLGCHSCGKEFTIGGLALWGALRGMLVLLISATEGQVLGQTMREVAAAFREAARALGIGYERFQRSIRIGGEARVIPLTGSANVDALTGWHDRNGVLTLISEGQGERLEDVAYDAALANATTERCRVLAAGNPVRPSGRFFEISRKAHWETFRTSAFDTPNVKAGETVLPGFPAPTWPAEVEREYGRESPFYIGRVLARFPAQDADALNTREWIERSRDLHGSGHLEPPARTPYTLGVDPARLGPDRTAVCIRQGPVVRGFEVWNGLDTMETAARVEAIVRRLISESTGPGYGAVTGVETVAVDVIGLGGGVLDRLKQTLPEVEWIEIAGSPYRPRPRKRHPQAVAFNASKTAHHAERFRNARAEAFWRLRKLLEEGALALPTNEALAEELLAIRVKFGADGRTEIEGKDALKGRLGRSPDLADALAIAFATDLEGAGEDEIDFR